MRDSPVETPERISERVKEILRRSRAQVAEAQNHEPSPANGTKVSARKSSRWKTQLAEIASTSESDSPQTSSAVPSAAFADQLIEAQHWFVFSVSDDANQRGKQMLVTCYQSTRKRNGDWSRPTGSYVSIGDSAFSTNTPALSPVERRAVAMLKPVGEHSRFSYHSRGTEARSFRIRAELLAASLEALHATGRLAWKLGGSEQHFEDARAVDELDLSSTWDLKVALAPCQEKATQLTLIAGLHRRDHAESVGETDLSFPIDSVIWASQQGVALVKLVDQPASETLNDADPGSEVGTSDSADPEPIIRTRLVRIDRAGAELIRAWQKVGTVTVPRRSLRTMLDQLQESQHGLELTIDPAIEIEQVVGRPQARCLLKQRERHRSSFEATLLVQYGDHEISFDSPVRWWWSRENNSIERRDRDAEQAWLDSIPTDEFELIRGSYERQLSVPPETFLHVVDSLQGAGWEVLADGAPIRVATDFNIAVSSGIDWFDVHADVDFDGVTASLPTLLAALRAGHRTVLLDDGTQGMLPTEWLRKFVGLESGGETIEAGDEGGGSIRFHRTQALLLDAMLEELVDVQSDRSFADFCRQLKSFDGVRPVEPPDSFVGTMRDYQKIGLGWFGFLQQFGFGGCLADDMGLGKIIQVLGVLEDRRQKRKDTGTHKPSIVVVPKSLVFNWIDEASKFTPQLRVLNYTGIDRRSRASEAGDRQVAATVHLAPHQG